MVGVIVSAFLLCWLPFAVMFAGSPFSSHIGHFFESNELADTVPGMTIIGTAAHKVPVMSFKIEGLHPSDIGTLLDQQGIAIRTGHHCAMPLMDFYGVPGTARASFAFYNTLEEVDQLFTGLQKIQRLFA